MSSIKYHVNPETYEVSVCSAKVQCRFANNDDVRHFDKDDVDNALKYAEELAERKYATMDSLSKNKVVEEAKETVDETFSISDKEAPFVELEAKRKEYFQNLSKKTDEEIKKAQIEEANYVLNNSSARGFYRKDSLIEIKEKLISNQPDHAIAKMREEYDRILMSKAYQMSDEDLVDVVREHDLLSAHELFNKNRSLLYKPNRTLDNHLSYENKIETEEYFGSEEKEELRGIAKISLLQNTKKYTYDDFVFGPSRIFLKRLALKDALKADNDLKIVKALDSLRNTEYQVLDRFTVSSLYSPSSDKWRNVNEKISDIVKAYNKERIKKAFKNNVSSEVN